MEHDYKNIISHIDIDRSLSLVEYLSFNGLEDHRFIEFKGDIESGNDSIESHLVRSNAYKEALILRLKKADSAYSEEWRGFLKEEQKTFGGSKIFYINKECTELLILSIPNEMRSKVNLVITRLNKMNDKITRINAKIKKENLEIYVSKIKSKEAVNKRKDEIINFINQNLKV